MNKNVMRIMLCVILIMTVFIFSTTKAITINPDTYKPGGVTAEETKPITDKFAVIVSALKTIGIVVAVITMMVIGIKYMMGSIEERVEYKKTMIPYIIGVFLIVALTQLLGVVMSIVQKVEL